MRWRALWDRAFRPLDAAGLTAFRVMFGGLLSAIAIRTILAGWIDRFYGMPRFFFPYPYFEWVQPLSPGAIHVLFAILAVCGVLISVGLFYRAACLTAFVAFTYVELIDVTRYLNHYYLVSLLLFLLTFLPLHHSRSIDVWLRPRIRAETLPAWITWLLRFQVGIVYFFAALAKATTDWLLYAQPLQLWLGAQTDMPVLGPLFAHLETAYAMSWAGFLYDLTIPLWLSMRTTRSYAYLVLLSFHTMTGLLFDIGMFPFIMSVAALVFFDPSWPRSALRRLRRSGGAAPGPRGVGITRPATATTYAPAALTPMRVAGASVIALWCAFHLLMPLRAHAYPGNLLWHEQGMRWSWRVLSREKNATVTYRVRARGWRHEREVQPRRYLTGEQETLFAAQPDMILALAHHVRDDYTRRGELDVEVYADVWASLNGRRSARLIDPEVDLARVELSFANAEWILPAPEGPPAQVARPGFAALVFTALGGSR